MSDRSEIFLTSFNRIEKHLRNQLGNTANLGFAEMIRRNARKHNQRLVEYEDDLLEFAQLRNAIVHSKIAEDFVIAEPNQWAVDRILAIENELMKPEKVFPRFRKHVTGFEKDVPLEDLLRTVAKKRFSQFPVYSHGKFLGLITLRVIGFWFAVESQTADFSIKDKQAADLLMSDGKSVNYEFVSANTTVYEVEERFHQNTFLEAVLITENGDPNGSLLGIIRPRDIFIEKEA